MLQECVPAESTEWCQDPRHMAKAYVSIGDRIPGYVCREGTEGTEGTERLVGPRVLGGRQGRTTTRGSTAATAKGVGWWGGRNGHRSTPTAAPREATRRGRWKRRSRVGLCRCRRTLLLNRLLPARSFFGGGGGQGKNTIADIDVQARIACRDSLERTARTERLGFSATRARAARAGHAPEWDDTLGLLVGLVLIVI